MAYEPRKPPFRTKSGAVTLAGFSAGLEQQSEHFCQNKWILVLRKVSNTKDEYRLAVHRQMGKLEPSEFVACFEIKGFRSAKSIRRFVSKTLHNYHHERGLSDSFIANHIRNCAELYNLDPDCCPEVFDGKLISGLDVPCVEQALLRRGIPIADRPSC